MVSIIAGWESSISLMGLILSSYVYRYDKCLKLKYHSVLNGLSFKRILEALPLP